MTCAGAARRARRCVAGACLRRGGDASPLGRRSRRAAGRGRRAADQRRGFDLRRRWPCSSGWPTAQTRGLDVNYTPTGSPAGPRRCSRGRTIDFAGTEAEFSSLGLGSDGAVARGFQYVPDVAGAVAVMYNVAGRGRAQGRLPAPVAARRSPGSSWATSPTGPTRRSPTTSAGSIALPDEPITVVYRSGQSGTTALFYDFVQNTEPGLFRRGPRGTGCRPTCPHHRAARRRASRPRPSARTGSDQIAQYVGRGRRGRSATTSSATPRCYGDDVAWIQNAGRRVGAALRREHLGRARVRPAAARPQPGAAQRVRQPEPGRLPDLGLQLHGHPVRARGRPADVQGPLRQRGGGRDARRAACATSPARARSRWPTSATRRCRRTSPRRSPTRSAACGAARPRRSRRRTAPTPASTRATCSRAARSRRRCRILPSTRRDTRNQGPNRGGTTTTTQCQTTTTSTTSSTMPTAPASTTATTAPDPCATPAAAAAGRVGDEEAVGGGSSDWRDVDPVAFDGPGMARIGRWPLLVVLLVLLLPVLGGTLVGMVHRRRLQRREFAELQAAGTPEAPPPAGAELPAT